MKKNVQGLLYSNRQLANLLLPLLIEQVLVMLVGMVDTVMVSSLGDAAVSGVSLVDMICVVLISMFGALATGGAVVASQMMGADRRADACRVANQLVLVVLGVSLVIAGAVLALRQPMLLLLFDTVEPDVMDSALTYLEITALSYPFIALYNAGTALYRSMNRSKETMVVSMLVNAINIVGNAICVYGLGMGVEGVAIPTLLSRVVGAFCMMVLLRNIHLQIHLLHGAWKPDVRMMKEIMRIGLPGGLENSLFQMGRVLVLRVITMFGTVQIAANAVACTMDALGIIPGQAMNLAIITVVGRCIGAQEIDQARYYTKKLLLWTSAAMLVINVPMLLGLPWILKLFDLSAEALELATILIMIHNGFGIVLWPISFTLPNALRAASDVRYTMIVAIASMGMFRVLFSYILGAGLGWGAVGVWVAMVFDWICRIICYVIRYRSGKWEKMARIAA